MTDPTPDAPSDWVLAPNIHHHAEVYALENAALRRDGRLEHALRGCADWAGRALVDVGCGTGFWLTEYARDAASVAGVEPDPALIERLAARTWPEHVSVHHGSAEQLPLPDASADVVHARFAYFFGAGAERGLAEVMRVLRPGGMFVAIDNSWRGGEFARLLDWSLQGNGTFDPEATHAWWAAQGARRVEVEGGWRAESPEQLERILRIEFAGDVVDRFLAGRAPSASISYHFALFVVTKPPVR
jgi:ubiquinone/menaquinone biosynthesis C-methylase UbiE